MPSCSPLFRSCCLSLQPGPQLLLLPGVLFSNLTKSHLLRLNNGMTLPQGRSRIQQSRCAFLPAVGVTFFILINPLLQTSGGKCLSVNKLSGDFRANLTPVQVTSCNSTAGQKWDIITSGKHNNQNGAMLVVSTLVSVCRSLLEFASTLTWFADTSLSQL